MDYLKQDVLYLKSRNSKKKKNLTAMKADNDTLKSLDIIQEKDQKYQLMNIERVQFNDVIFRLKEDKTSQRNENNEWNNIK